MTYISRKFIGLCFLLLFSMIFKCSGNDNIIYIIEDKSNSDTAIEFYGKNKAMFIHSEGNEFVFTANIKLSSKIRKLKSISLILYDKNETPLSEVPYMYLNPSDLELLDKSEGKFQRVRFRFDMTNIHEPNPNKRYQMSRRWIVTTRRFKIFTNYISKDGEIIVNDENSKDQGSTNKQPQSMAELVKKLEPSVFLIMNKDSNGNTQSIGTGFFIGENKAVSNYHVFKGGSSWFIKLYDSRVFEVDAIIKQSEPLDFIVFTIKTDISFPYLPISNEIPLKGTDIIVLGNPNGLENSVTKGIISAIRDNMIQIDAAISPGSSGSPVLNLYGEVMGIATLKIMNCENCNFAYKISVINN